MDDFIYDDKEILLLLVVVVIQREIYLLIELETELEAKLIFPFFVDVDQFLV